MLFAQKFRSLFLTSTQRLNGIYLQLTTIYSLQMKLTTINLGRDYSISSHVLEIDDPVFYLKISFHLIHENSHSYASG